MQIVIVGAGHIGLHLAAQLSNKDHNVILVDKDPLKIEEASSALDIATKVGSGTDLQLLDQLREFSPDILLAMTNNDETNLVICAIASSIGYKKTIARISQNHFTSPSKVNFNKLFKVDSLLAPDLLVANDIYKLMTMQNATCVENFAHGAIQLRTFKIPNSWKKSEIPLYALDLSNEVKLALIKRDVPDLAEPIYIFPHGEDTLHTGDEVTLIGKRLDVMQMQAFFGVKEKKIHSVVIVGGSRVGYHLAQLLCKENIHVRLINRDLESCELLADLLPKAEILNHDASDLEFLIETKIEHCDCFVTCTRNEETNLIVGKLALQAGAKHVVARIENPVFEMMAKEIGIHQTVLMHKSFENQVFAIINSQRIASMVLLYENEAEILELTVSSHSKTIGIPIQELAITLPKDFLFAALHNNGIVTVINGQTTLQAGDNVIVISHPKHLPMLNKLF